MKKQPNIDWLFFDVGGTLLDNSIYGQWRLKTILEIVRKYRPNITEQDITAVVPKASGMIDNLDKNIITCLLPEEQKAELAELEMRRRWAREKEGVDYYQQPIRPEGKPAVKILAKDYKLGLLANQSTKIREKLDAAGLLPYFAHTGVSADYRLIKPDPRLWLEVFKETGAIPNRAAVVDDNIERCLVPAKKFGMTTVWYKLRERDNVPIGAVDYTITSLNDLLEIF